MSRKNPTRAASSESQYSLMEFVKDFKDDDACLEWLWRTRCATDKAGEWANCPKCETERRFKKYATSQGRQSWTCTACGQHVHPTAGTIFHKSRTSLHLWFYAIYLITSTRCGISAKQLERELGVTYKTAWRMFNLIRNSLMEQGDEPLSGDVEVDETAYGGKMRMSDVRKGRGFVVKSHRPTVFGMVERGGRVKATVIPNRGAPAIRQTMRKHILPSSMIFTDEFRSYEGLDRRYLGHKRIRHATRVYVSGDVHTQTIEGFFGLLKTGIRGVYHSVSEKWLQGYLNEYAWRYSERDSGRVMFHTLLHRAAAG